MTPEPALPVLSERADLAEQTEARLLAAALALVESGAAWDERLVERASASAGLSGPEASFIVPQGARDLAALLWKRHDALALQALGEVDPAALKVRERIRTAVQRRLDVAFQDRAAVEAASRFLARPSQAGLALRLGWETADGIWRWAGDAATDANHYSKRALLWGVMAATLAVRLTRGEAAAQQTLDDRIADVMRIGALTAKAPPIMDGLTVVAAQLGRLRYEGLGGFRR